MLPESLLGQHFFRIKADFSIKEKLADGKDQLIMGTVYYDKNYKKLVYDIRFPEAETWVLRDTFFYSIKPDETEVFSFPAFTEFTMFHYALSGNLHDYGIDDKYYQVGNVIRDEGMVITTYHIIQELEDLIGDIIISQKDRKIYGIAFYDAEENLLNRQFFRDYVNVRGLEFPTRIIQIAYVNDQELYKETRFRNVKVNDLQDNHIYNYDVSDIQPTSGK